MNTQKLQDEYRDVAGRLALHRVALAWAISELEGLANGLDKSGITTVTAENLREIADGLKFEAEGNE